MAGPYDHYEDSFTYADGKVVPLGIYCRKTMSKFLDHQELFTITKQVRISISRTLFARHNNGLYRV